jgi:hypothetical protein
MLDKYPLGQVVNRAAPSLEPGHERLEVGAHDSACLCRSNRSRRRA